MNLSTIKTQYCIKVTSSSSSTPLVIVLIITPVAPEEEPREVNHPISTAAPLYGFVSLLVDEVM